MRKCLLRAGLVGLWALIAGFALGAEPVLVKDPGKTVSQKEAENRLKGAAVRFSENKGQWDARARFLGRSQNLNYWITDDGVVIDYFRRVAQGDDQGAEGHVVGMSFVGGAKARPQGLRAHRMIESYTAAGQTSGSIARTFNEVYSRSIYPGIDVRTYFSSGKPRYDLIVHPGADASSARLAFKGVSSVRIDRNGDLVIPTSISDIRHAGLFAYQMVDGKRRQVAASFQQIDATTIGFKLGRYDRSKTLVIDPVVYGSYYGGDNGLDQVHGVASDTEGGVFLTGWTQSPRFPAIYGPYGFVLQGSRDMFVTKFQGDAYSHDYAAYVGGNLDESGDMIAKDPFGNVWVAGRTRSTNFPGNTKPNVVFLNGDPTASGGTFLLQYNGVPTTPLPWNATAAQIQAALAAIPAIGAGNVTVTGGPLPLVPIRIQLPVSRPGVFTVDSLGMWAEYLVERRPNWQGQLLVAESNAVPSAGTFQLRFQGQNTAPLDFNATAAAVQAALEALPTIGPGNVLVEQAPPIQAIPTGTYLIAFQGAMTGTQPLIQVLNASLTGQYRIDRVDRQAIFANPDRSLPTGGGFQLAFQGAATGLIPWNANQAVIETALTGLATIGVNNVMVRAEPSGQSLPGSQMVVSFIGTLAGQNQPLLEINSGPLQPKPNYTIQKFSNLFVMRFARSGSGLNPLPTRTFMIGDLDSAETLGGFAVVPKDEPVAGDPVQIVVAGTSAGPIPEITGPRNGSAYMVRFNYNDNGTFTPLASNSRYLASSLGVDLTGAAADAEGNFYVGGSVASATQIDTSINPAFATTAGVFEGGRLLRRTDMFIRKYDPNGTMLYSALIGGNGDESAGGVVADPTGARLDVGSSIAVDPAGNLYITGISRSFNYPRTRGVYGEVFSAAPVVVVTKVNGDASEILYSTNLQTQQNVLPSGIAVDSRGNAFITGVVGYSLVQFPATPGDPNMPQTVQTNSSVPLTADAPDAEYTSPTAQDIPTTEGFLLVLNSTGTDLVFGTYLGGLLDEIVWGPHVDKFGDVWVMGYTDTRRFYQRVSTTGAVTTFDVSGSLPETLLTPLAFKRSPDPAGLTTIAGIWYGLLENPIFPPPPATISAGYQRDGFLVRFRVGLPAIQNVILSPNSIAGGLGAFSDGIVTLSTPAPAGGIEISLDLTDTSVASFDPSAPVGQQTVTIPEGANAAIFRVYSAPVAQPTAVDVRASYEGNFKVARLTVSPWLAQLTLTPTSVVGGNNVTGRIRLFQTPTQPVTVTVSTDNQNLISFPAGTTVTVPPGQDSITFPVATDGVSATTVANVTASLLGVGRTQPLTVTTADMLQLTFTPPRVTGGTLTTGTLRLNGEAGSTFQVTLSLSNGTPNSYELSQTTLTFNPGDTQRSFTLRTGYEANNTQRTVTATRAAQGNYSAQSVQGTIFVDAADLLTFTITPNQVNGGQTATGTVSINVAAGAGGAVVNLTSDNAVASVPQTVTIPAGESQVSFDIQTVTTASQATANITASRGGGSPLVRQLTVNALTYGVTLNPSTVLGGNTTTGTVTLSGPAPAGGLQVALSSSHPAATVPATVTVPQGVNQAVFTVNTSVVSSVVQATIGAQVGSNPLSSALLEIRPVRVQGLEFTPRRTKGGRVVQMKVMLDGPAPVGGAQVTITSTNTRIVNLPASVSIPAGQDFVVVSVSTRRVSRTLAATVTGNYNGQGASGVITVTR
jgi:hypothetical protein